MHLYLHRDWSYLPTRPARPFKRGISLNETNDPSHTNDVSETNDAHETSESSCSLAASKSGKSLSFSHSSHKPLRRLSWFLPPENQYKVKSSKVKARTLSVDHSDDEPQETSHMNGVLNSLRSSFRHYTSTKNRKEVGS